VQTRVVVADLSKPDVGATVEAATADLDVGLLVYNACRSVIGEFLELSLEDKLGTLDVNCRGLVQLTSVYAPKLVARGRGGLLIMSSMSGFQGTAMVGTYAATKAFDTVLGEALWEELQPQGVDVLVCAAGATRTPGFDRNTPEDKRADAFPMTADEVAEAALGQLGHGPTFVPGALNRFAYLVTTRLLPRRLAIRFLSRTTRGLYA
jgi:short-subunit dehydrogenase